MEYLKKYCKYIVNTGQIPLPICHFDEDWEPIGPQVRGDLDRNNLIHQSAEGVSLTLFGEQLAEVN